MNPKKNWKNREILSHTTQTEPYAIYHVMDIAPGKDLTLYHWHPEAELFYLADGEADFYLENNHFHMSAGSTILIPPNRLHSAVCPAHSGASFYALVFSTDLIARPNDVIHFQKYVQPFLRHTNTGHLLFTPEQQWHVLFLEHLRTLLLSSEDSNHSDLMVRGTLLLLWDLLYTHLLADFSQSNQAEHLELLLQPVLHYIHDHYADNLSLKLLADQVHVSEAHLCRSFKEFTGSTPFVYLKRYRLAKSCELLIHSDKKISEICSLCGFNNVSYYNREFVQLLKMTPSDYRRNACHIHRHNHF